MLTHLRFSIEIVVWVKTSTFLMLQGVVTFWNRLDFAGSLLLGNPGFYYPYIHPDLLPTRLIGLSLSCSVMYCGP